MAWFFDEPSGTIMKGPASRRLDHRWGNRMHVDDYFVQIAAIFFEKILFDLP
jgi:hypothetical protein